ncbi:hypothetical protein D8L93_09245 [Sodalis-like symbiont of Bactericera trigonica]|nr:hypothetical protein D8L93_09245 [Sodalis-like symbiont of Bactericera trigonica]
MIGYNDTEDSAYFLPALTTVSQDFNRLWQEAVKRLLARLGQGGGKVDHSLSASRKGAVPPAVRRQAALPRRQTLDCFGPPAAGSRSRGALPAVACPTGSGVARAVGRGVGAYYPPLLPARQRPSS